MGKRLRCLLVKLDLNGHIVDLPTTQTIDSEMLEREGEPTAPPQHWTGKPWKWHSNENFDWNPNILKFFIRFNDQQLYDLLFIHLVLSQILKRPINIVCHTHSFPLYPYARNSHSITCAMCSLLVPLFETKFFTKIFVCIVVFRTRVWYELLK